jgi:HTH-type transcriptional regulator / antitoxin HigA
MATLTRKPRSKALPGVKPVRNERDRQTALARVDVLMRARELSQVETDELEVLAILIASYEHEKFPRGNVTPQELLESLVTDAGHKQKDIAEGTGIAASTISEILHGKREINARQAVALGKYFGVRADAFLPRS